MIPFFRADLFLDFWELLLGFLVGFLVGEAKRTTLFDGRSWVGWLDGWWSVLQSMKLVKGVGRGLGARLVGFLRRLSVGDLFFGFFYGVEGTWKRILCGMSGCLRGGLCRSGRV